MVSLSKFNWDSIVNANKNREVGTSFIMSSVEQAGAKHVAIGRIAN